MVTGLIGGRAIEVPVLLYSIQDSYFFTEYLVKAPPA